MRQNPVAYRQVALDDLAMIFSYVFENSRDAVTARRYVDRIFARCEAVGNAPWGGVSREDLGPGIRLVPFEPSAVILYTVEKESVCITDIFAGGRDYEALLRDQGE